MSWTNEHDLLLRKVAGSIDVNGLKRHHKWESISRLIPGSTPDQCQARWMVLSKLPGLDHKPPSLLAQNIGDIKTLRPNGFAPTPNPPGARDPPRRTNSFTSPAVSTANLASTVNPNTASILAASRSACRPPSPRAASAGPGRTLPRALAADSFCASSRQKLQCSGSQAVLGGASSNEHLPIQLTPAVCAFQPSAAPAAALTSGRGSSRRESLAPGWTNSAASVAARGEPRDGSTPLPPNEPLKCPTTQGTPASAPASVDGVSRGVDAATSEARDNSEATCRCTNLSEMGKSGATPRTGNDAIKPSATSSQDAVKTGTTPRPSKDAGSSTIAPRPPNDAAKPTVEHAQADFGRSSADARRYLGRAPGTPSDIVIHVSDDARRISRDFSCSRKLLLSHMKYFSPYLTADRGHNEIDISVHCDIEIFEWLIEYMHRPEDPPQMEASSVLSILISAEFLQMSSLVQHCIHFLHSHLNEIIKLPLDMGCVSDQSVERLAELFDATGLEAIKDKKDKIISRLYLKKTAQMMSQEENKLHRCAFCQKPFTTAQKDWEPCPCAPELIDFHGKAITEHVVNRSWDMHKWIASLQQRSRNGARETYWRLWGLTHSLCCSACGVRFPVSELEHCAFHPSEPKFDMGENHGIYPCCGKNAVRFDSSAKRRGCQVRRHTPELRERFAANCNGGLEGAVVLELALAHADAVFIPFEGFHEDRRAAAPATNSDLAQAPACTANDSEDAEGSRADSGTATPVHDRPRSSTATCRPTRNTFGSDVDGSSSDDQSDDGADSDGTSGRSDSFDDFSDSSDDSQRDVQVKDKTGRATDSRGESRFKGACGSGLGSSPRRGMQVDALNMEDELQMRELSRALEQKRAPPKPLKEPSPSLAGPKAMYLDWRQIRHISRAGGVGVVWPRTIPLGPSKEAARERGRSVDAAGMVGART
ncbi:hypothetical protein AB1Y20_000803 [Prymnesium parvum]|uniref:SANT and BTB domain-containing protein n=1 Tax=Prymnesium parvum TaxID=97485 RepID=A0AB34K9P0_PRYPA